MIVIRTQHQFHCDKFTHRLSFFEHGGRKALQLGLNNAKLKRMSMKSNPISFMCIYCKEPTKVY